MKSSAPKITIKVTNSLRESRILMLEPWAGEYDLHPGKTLLVVAEGDLSYPLEIELAEDRVIVHGFDTTNSMLTVFDGSKELRSK